MINQMQPQFGVEEAQAAYDYIMSGGWLTDFKKTRELESVIAKYVGAKYCCIVNSGTTALQIALMAMDIGRGDKVVVPSYTMAASAYVVSLVGAEIVLCDVNKDTYNLDPEKLWQVIKKYNPDCIMHVSIDGRSSPIEEICKTYKDRILICEDACQSLGSKLNGKHLGTFGDIGVLSLNTFKIISAGQMGCLITDNKSLHDKIIRIKDYGRAGGRGSDYEMLGMNAKVSDLSSVVALEQMKKLDGRVSHKKEMFKWYRELLFGIDEVRFIPTNLDDCSPWYYDPLVENRDGLIKYLANNGIECQPFYPPIHKLACYHNYWGDFKNSEYVSEHGIWLPSSSILDRPTIEFICSKIKEFYSR